MAKQAEQANKVVNKQPENIASAIPITKEELDEQKVNELNDLMKNDYVKVVEVHHSKKTYIILFLILALLVAFIIFEVIHYGGKL